ncbi:MAG: hypothetical protein ACR2QO_24175 [Acidimicrobiales bacterium]
MTAPAANQTRADRWQQLATRTSTSLLGRDTPSDFALVLATFAVFVVLDRWTSQIALIEAADLERFSLNVAAAGDRWWLLVPLAAVFVAGFAIRPAEMLAPWSTLQHGTALRVATVVLAGLLAWQSSLYGVNFLAGQVHAIDRILVVVLALAVAARPSAIVPFVLVVRVSNEQFLHPFGTAAAKNVDELIILALLSIAATHAIYVLTRRTDTSAALLIASAAVAAHFFLPGRGKLANDWLQTNDVSEFPLSSWTAGWLAHTDGGFPEAMSAFYETFSWPVLVGTLVIEVGAIVGVFHPKLFRLWLAGFIAFHAMTFATTGFFFLGWTLLEVALLVAVAAPQFRSWIAANATPARGLLAAGAVLAGAQLFHPPGLAWLDAPVSYGYRLEATGVSGEVYNVPLGAVDPYSQDLSFLRPQLADRPLGTAGYGAIITHEELNELRAIQDFESLEAHERALGPPPDTSVSIEFVVSYFDHVNSGERRSWFGLGPPQRYWNSRDEPVFDFDEPLQRLDVFILAAIHTDDGVIRELRPVLAVEADSSGRGVVTATTP